MSHSVAISLRIIISRKKKLVPELNDQPRYHQLTAISLTEPDERNTAVSKILVFDMCLMGLIHQEKNSIVRVCVCISYKYCICCTRLREVD